MNFYTVTSKTASIFLITAVSLGVLISGNLKAAEGDTVHKEALIKVEPKIIALPGNKAPVVPIKAARVRSTELRELNTQYNATKIERVFEIKEIAAKKGQSLEKTKKADVTTVFTNKKRKEKIALGEEVVEVKNVFIIQFELDPDISMTSLLNAYRELSAVVSIEEVVRD